ncbi:sensor histidine kinase [Allostreptomyces psammosilenae]|uniref:histidine kinase n=1 Tax=Allostreptomyces psammosilenae TaxID=1892865 RepID=A0A852ZTR2_9ACTN|nr:sensor histidine kinase [Allostreptomyces psammosilenae]NYI05719.1 signal transduction histidine kinase [Allostreptomyces psammosilenae]
MQRVYAWLRRHPMAVDSAWALLLLVVGMPWGFAMSTLQFPVFVAISAGMVGCLALRRRWPGATTLIMAGLALAQVAADILPHAINAAFLVTIYTAAAYGPRWSSRFAFWAGLAASPITLLRWSRETLGPNTDTGALVTQGLFLAVPFVLAWVIGDSVRTRRAYYAELEDRAERLERQRDAQAKVAVAAERARIARELHDVVAHNVSVMVVQADGAAFVLDNSPEQAKQALATISTTGRQALSEMRRLLGVLRAQDGDGKEPAPGSFVPQPSVEQIEELLQQVREAGLPVQYRTVGDVRPLPPGVELTAYRIVQEALTNTRKHAGPAASARVSLTYGPSDLEVTVEDDGRGVAALRTGAGGGTDPDSDATGGGLGLIGMRERTGMVGGTLETGPLPGAGFRVRAVIPLRTSG